MRPRAVIASESLPACSRVTKGRVSCAYFPTSNGRSFTAISLIAILVLYSIPSFAALTSTFSYQRTLTPVHTSSSGVGIVELDGPAGDAWGDGRTNLLVFDESASNPAPVLLREGVPVDVPTTDEPVPMTILSWVTQAEGAVEIVLEMKDLTQSPNRFKIGADRAPFYIRCALSSSLDCAEWTPLTSTQNLFLVAGTSLDQSGMNLDTHGAFYFKILLTAPSAEDVSQLMAASEGAIGGGTNFNISSNDLQFSEIQHSVGPEHVLAEDRPRVLEPISNTVVGQTIYRFSSDGLPVHRLEVNAETLPAHLSVRVLSQAGPDAEWVEIAHQTLYHFSLSGEPFSALTIVLDHPQRSASYRLQFDSAVAAVGVKALGPAIWLQFPCEASHAYCLYHGGSSTALVSVAGMLDGAAVPFQLGPMLSNPELEKMAPAPVEVVEPEPTTPTPPVTPPPTVTPPVTLNDQGRHQLLQVALGLMAVCWIWFLGRLFKGNRA